MKTKSTGTGDGRENRGRYLAEKRRSSAAGAHGKTRPDRRNTRRAAITFEHRAG
jgi:hypothetical protein